MLLEVKQRDRRAQWSLRIGHLQIESSTIASCTNPAFVVFVPLWRTLLPSPDGLALRASRSCRHRTSCLKGVFTDTARSTPAGIFKQHRPYGLSTCRGADRACCAPRSGVARVHEPAQKRRISPCRRLHRRMRCAPGSCHRPAAHRSILGPGAARGEHTCDGTRLCSSLRASIGARTSRARRAMCIFSPEPWTVHSCARPCAEGAKHMRARARELAQQAYRPVRPNVTCRYLPERADTSARLARVRGVR